MCADGYVIRDNENIAIEIQDQARAVISAGPRALSDEERVQRRYSLTDLQDDLRGSANDVEIIFIASQLLEMAGRLVLVDQRRWLGAGKWLARHLDETSGSIAIQLTQAFRTLVISGDKRPLLDVVSEILERAGGPITEGYIAHKFVAE